MWVTEIERKIKEEEEGGEGEGEEEEERDPKSQVALQHFHVQGSKHTFRSKDAQGAPNF